MYTKGPSPFFPFIFKKIVDEDKTGRKKFGGGRGQGAGGRFDRE